MLSHEKWKAHYVDNLEPIQLSSFKVDKFGRMSDRKLSWQQLNVLSRDAKEIQEKLQSLPSQRLSFVEAIRTVQTDAKLAIMSSENLEPSIYKKSTYKKRLQHLKIYKNTIDQLTQKKNNNFAVCSECFIPE